MGLLPSSRWGQTVPRAHARTPARVAREGNPSGIPAETAAAGPPLPLRLAWRYRRELAPLAAGAGLLLAAEMGHDSAPDAWPLILPAAWLAGGLAALRCDRAAERAYAAALAVGGSGWLALAWAHGPADAHLLATLAVGGLALAMPWWAHQRPHGDVEVIGGSRWPWNWEAWNLRRAGLREIARVRRDWPAAVGAAGLEGAAIRRAVVDEAGYALHLELRAGQTLEDVARALPRLASALDGRRGGVRVAPDPEDRARRCVVRVTHEDPLADLIEWPGPQSDTITEPIALGLFEDGEEVLIDLTAPEHTLIAGVTGAGKGSVINALVGSLAACGDVTIWAIDPAGGVELGPWGDVLERVAESAAAAPALLQAARDEVQRRMRVLRAAGRRDWSADLGPWWVLAVDELAALQGRSMGLIGELAAMSRKTGLRLVLATQRPLAELLGGHATLREQLRRRIAMHVGEDDVDMCLGGGRAREGWRPHELIEPGAFLIYDPAAGYTTPRPARAYWVSDEAVAFTAERCRLVRPQPISPSLDGGGPSWTASQEPPREADSTDPDRRALRVVDARDDPLYRLREALSAATDEGTRVEALARAVEMSDSWTYERLRALVDQGEAERVGRARYRAVGAPRPLVNQGGTTWP